MEILTDLQKVNIDASEIHIDPNQIETFLGYPEGQTPDFMKENIREVITTSRSYIKVSAGYTIQPVSRGADKSKLFVADKIFKIDKIISAQMNRAEYVAIFLCTIGPDMENWIKSLNNDGEIMSGFIADHVASEAVEKAVDILNDRVLEHMKPLGFGATFPFSPGYCGWHVSEQPLLFSFFPKNEFGITLTESHLMVPIKSVSGIIGIGKEAKQRVYPCKICTFKDCYKNRS